MDLFRLGGNTVFDLVNVHQHEHFSLGIRWQKSETDLGPAFKAR
jgi:hypothetical protein